MTAKMKARMKRNVVDPKGLKWMTMTALVVAALTGCSSSSHDSDAGSDVHGSADVAPDLPPGIDAVDLPAPEVAPLPCHLEETSDLPGVSIHVLRDDCTFTTAQARAGIGISYEVVVDQDVDVTVAPAPGSYCYGPGPSGLLILEALSGSGQKYCLCDRGLPYGQYCQTQTTVRRGTYPATFEWDGVNWGGPSDTSVPKGMPFPPGSYRLDITAKGSRTLDAGTAPFTVNAAFGVNLID